MGVSLCLDWTLDETAFWIWSFNRYLDVRSICKRGRGLKGLVIIPPQINSNHPRLLLYKFHSVTHHDLYINWKRGDIMYINNNLESIEYRYLCFSFLEVQDLYEEVLSRNHFSFHSLSANLFTLKCSLGWPAAKAEGLAKYS